MIKGNMIRLKSIGEDHVITQVWTVVNMKSDSRGIWIQIDDDSTPDTWYAADMYEVIDGSR